VGFEDNRPGPEPEADALERRLSLAKRAFRVPPAELQKLIAFRAANLARAREGAEGSKMVMPMAVKVVRPTLKDLEHEPYRFRKWLYWSRLDRAALLGSGLGLVAAAVLTVTHVLNMSQSLELTLAVGILGVQMVASVIQSGREGHLWWQLRVLMQPGKDKVSLVPGHRNIHEAQEELLKKTDEGVLLLESWSGPGRDGVTEAYKNLQRVMNGRLRRSSKFVLEAAVVCDSANWKSCRRILHGRLGRRNVDQRFLVEHPLPVDFMVGDKEALISIPDLGGDQAFAFQVHDKEMVARIRTLVHDAIMAEPDGVSVKEGCDLKVVTDKIAKRDQCRSGI